VALTISALEVLRSGRPVISGLDLEVRSGTLAGLLGPNGAGKSTLLEATAGLIPSRGSVRLDTRELNALSAPARARLGVRFVGGRWVIPELTVREHLRLVQLGGAERVDGEIFELFPRLRDRLDTVA
jgi:ABC-type branched-subunit amino acid transport system ATPase component